MIWATGNVLLAYNAAFFLSFPLCAIGAHLLTYQITKAARPGGGGRSRVWLRAVSDGAVRARPGAFQLLDAVRVAGAPQVHRTPLALSRALRRVVVSFRRSRAAITCSICRPWSDCGSSGLPSGRIRWADFGRLMIAWAAATLAFLPIALGYLKCQRAVPAPLAGRDPGVQRRRRQRAQSVWQPPALGLAERCRSTRVGAVSRAGTDRGDRSRCRAGLDCCGTRPHCAACVRPACCWRARCCSASSPPRPSGSVPGSWTCSGSGSCRCGRYRNRSRWPCC